MSTITSTGTATINARGRLDIVFFDIDERAFLETLPDAMMVNGRYTATPSPLACSLLLERGYQVGEKSMIRFLGGLWERGQRSQDTERAFETKTNPWEHQRRSYDFAFDRPASLIASGMGTGKTKVTVDLLSNWARLCKTPMTAIVTCPKIVIDHWPREFDTHGAGSAEVIPLDKSAKKNAATVEKWFGKADKLTVFAVNHEAVWREELARVLLSKQWGAIAVDESHKVKSHNSTVSNFLYKLGRKAWRRLALTGTPMPNNPGDIYGQFRFLEPMLLGTSFTRFRSRFATMNPHIPGAVAKWINQEQLQEIVAEITFRVESDDVLDLPETQDLFVGVEMGPKGRKLYDELRDELCTEYDGNEITADNALVKLLRLQQLTSGFVGDDQKQVHQVDDAKAKAFSDWVSWLPPEEPAVVFSRFRDERPSIRAAAERAGRRYLEISGDKNDRDTFIDRGKPGDVLCIQIQSGGTGLDGLQNRCRFCAYLSTGLNRGDYEQSRKRVHRPGQERHVRYYHFHAKKSVDVAMFQAFRDKAEIVAYVMQRVRRV